MLISGHFGIPDCSIISRLGYGNMFYVIAGIVQSLVFHHLFFFSSFPLPYARSTFSFSANSTWRSSALRAQTTCRGSVPCPSNTAAAQTMAPTPPMLRLSTCLFARRYACLHVCLLVVTLVYMSVCSSLRLSTCLFARRYACLHVCLLVATTPPPPPPPPPPFLVGL